MRPISRLRWVSDEKATRIDTGRERAECFLDESGRSTRWRIWERGADGRWRPENDWRYPSAAMSGYRPQWSPGGAA